MTYTKQIKELEALIEKLGSDFRIFEIMDTWKIKYDGPMGMKRSEEVREVVTLQVVYDQFVNKTGVFYEAFKVTASFRAFVKNITQHYYVPRRRDIVYEDSYNKFHEEWNKIHPEITYEKYERQEDEREGRRIDQLMAPYVESYFKIRNFLS